MSMLLPKIKGITWHWIDLLGFGFCFYSLRCAAGTNISTRSRCPHYEGLRKVRDRNRKQEPIFPTVGATNLRMYGLCLCKEDLIRCVSNISEWKLHRNKICLALKRKNYTTPGVEMEILVGTYTTLYHTRVTLFCSALCEAQVPTDTPIGVGAQFSIQHSGCFT